MAAGLTQFISSVGTLVRSALVIVSSLALVAFFFGLAKFMFKASTNSIEQGKQFMIWGTLAMFVMLSVWGIVGFIQHELGLPQTAFGLSSPTTGTFGSPFGACDPSTGVDCSNK